MTETLQAESLSQQINAAMDEAWQAFLIYKNLPLKKRAHLLRTIADEITNLGDALLDIAAQETNLPKARLQNERGRTIFQLTSYADACERGDWLEASIDTADANRVPSRPDIRKMMVALGPVVVFGASNFPFAFSTAGGDTACALAAGCPVIIKAHPAHSQTSACMATAITNAVKKCKLPSGTFTHIQNTSYAAGELLVKHPHTKAVGFTGSYRGGKTLFDWASQRKEPIPVFAEMGSVNPVFLLPQKLKDDAAGLAKSLAASVTLGVGQFCTSPGLIIGIESEYLQQFIQTLGTEIKSVPPGKMLHSSIAKAYTENKLNALSQPDVDIVAASTETDAAIEGAATIATASAATFLSNSLLQPEIFGPYSLVVRCKDEDEMLNIAQQLEGQLTATFMATTEDIAVNTTLLETVKNICGRLLLNNVPTGVEVCLSMQHGGPFPASTDSRFTSVGADGIKRFVRPLSFQNWNNELLPDELKNENPLNIWRTVNNERTKETIS